MLSFLCDYLHAKRLLPKNLASLNTAPERLNGPIRKTNRPTPWKLSNIRIDGRIGRRNDRQTPIHRIVLAAALNPKKNNLFLIFLHGFLFN